MRKLLFVTTRNIVRTCGELRLIKNRAEALYSEYGIKTDFLILTNVRMDNMQEELSYDAKVVIKQYSLSNPVALISYLNRITHVVEQNFNINEYTDVMISGLFIPFALKRMTTKWPQKNYSMDIHGAYEDIFSSVETSRIFKRFIYRIVFSLSKKFEPKFYKYINNFFVVSPYLEEYIRELSDIDTMRDKNFFLVPCALSGDAIDDTFYNKNRYLYRERYGFDDEDIVMIYSGGNSPWQCFDKSMNFYIKSRANNEHIKFLVLSQDIQEIKSQYGEIEGVQYDSLSAKDVYGALCCADYGLLLRNASVTNACAYPNKFLEYVNARLLVITNDSVKAIKKHVEEYSVGIIISENDVMELKLNDLDDKRKKYEGMKLIHDTGFKMTLKGFGTEDENSIY